MPPCGTWNANNQGGGRKRRNCLELIGPIHQTSSKAFALVSTKLPQIKFHWSIFAHMKSRNSPCPSLIIF